MTAYRRVYDLRHLQADCQEPGSAPKPYARVTSMGYLAFLQTDWVGRFEFSSCAVNEAEQCGRAPSQAYYASFHNWVDIFRPVVLVNQASWRPPGPRIPVRGNTGLGTELPDLTLHVRTRRTTTNRSFG